METIFLSSGSASSTSLSISHNMRPETVGVVGSRSAKLLTVFDDSGFRRGMRPNFNCLRRSLIELEMLDEDEGLLRPWPEGWPM